MVVPQRGYSRRFVRRKVAQEIGDLIVATATAAGDHSTFIDSTNLTREYMWYRNSQIVFSDGTAQNIGEVRVVVGSDVTTRSLTLNPELPAAIQLGDEAEIYNLKGLGWTVDMYNRAIDGALASASESHAVFPTSFTVVDPINYRSHNPSIAIPYHFAFFSGIEYSNREGSYHLPYRYWEVDPYTRTVIIKGQGREMISRSTVTLLGSTVGFPLETDDDITLLPIEWLVSEVKAVMEEQDVARGAVNQRDRLFNANRQGADARRTIIVRQHGPNTVRLI